MKTQPQILIAGMLLATIGTGLGQINITNQPQNQTNAVGTTATFTVGATGTEPLAYQWQKKDYFGSLTDLADSTNATLVLTNVQTSHDADYRVVVTNIQGSAISDFAHLYVIVPPAITLQPTNWPSVSLGASVTNRVGVSGTAPLAYQWCFKGAPLPGQTKTSILLTNVQLYDAGDYTAVVTNLAGSVTSRIVTLAVDPTFTKITQGRPATDSESSVCVTWIDYDQDGYLDLLVGNATGSGNVLNSLYHNERNGTFTKITTNLIGTVAGSTWGTAWGDYDNDGRPDLFVSDTGNRRAAQFHNEGGGRFTQVTTGVIVRDLLDSTIALWGDYDIDGFIDLLVPNGYWSGPQNDRLYHNEGGSGFRITTAAEVGPLVNDNARSLAFGWIDYDNDGLLDVFIQYTDTSGTWASNFVFRGSLSGPFEKVPLPDFDIAGQSAGQSWGDYDNDGYPEVFLPAGNRTNALFKYVQRRGFTNLAASAGLQLRMGSWASGWADYDNDGWLDLFVGNYQGMGGYPGGSALFHNNHDGTFTRITTGSPANEGGYATAVAWGDYDNDGFPDLYLACGDGTPQRNLFYRNSLRDNGNSNHWLKVTLDGRASNRLGIGAKVRVLATIGSQTFWQMRTITGAQSWLGENGLIAHFGLGDATNVTTLRIEWPSGIVQELQNVATNQFLTVVEHQEEARTPPSLAASKSGDGKVQLSVTGQANLLYAFEASTDLVQWTKIAVRTNLTGTLEFTPPTSSGPRQFYRVLMP